MMNIGIVAYTAEEFNSKVTVRRAYGGLVDELVTDDFDELVDFLTEDKGKAIHICWSLFHFTTTIFSLLPIETQKELDKKARVYVGNTKIFSVDRLLGITARKHLKGNFYSQFENNFYSVSHWLPEAEPPTAEQLEKIGYEIIESLGELGIYPEKLTSPIGLYSEQLDFEKLPTIFNFNEDYLDAMNYSDQIARLEWRKVYKNNKKGVYSYDLTSAYGYFISQLPDTRNIIAKFSDKWLSCDWGIVKGKLTIDSKVSPVRQGEGYFTTEEIRWIADHFTGKFKMQNGWFIKFTSNNKPYQAIINNLVKVRRESSGLTETLAKKITQGLSGKLDQYNKDGTMGELYNPILACMVRSRCRLAVGDFVYNNNLVDELVEIKVDGVKATKKLDLPTKSLPGEWRIVEDKIGDKNADKSIGSESTDIFTRKDTVSSRKE